MRTDETDETIERLCIAYCDARYNANTNECQYWRDYSTSTQDSIRAGIRAVREAVLADLRPMPDRLEVANVVREVYRLIPSPTWEAIGPIERAQSEAMLKLFTGRTQGEMEDDVLMIVTQKAEMNRLGAERDEARLESCSCAFCGESISNGGEGDLQRIQDHVADCPEHPLAKATAEMKAEIDRLKVELAEARRETEMVQKAYARLTEEYEEKCQENFNQTESIIERCDGVANAYKPVVERLQSNVRRLVKRVSVLEARQAENCPERITLEEAEKLVNESPEEPLSEDAITEIVKSAVSRKTPSTLEEAMKDLEMSYVAECRLEEQLEEKIDPNEQIAEERDQMQDRVDRIALALNLSEEESQWSNVNDVGEACIERIAGDKHCLEKLIDETVVLSTTLDSVRKELAEHSTTEPTDDEVERLCEVYCEAHPRLCSLDRLTSSGVDSIRAAIRAVARELPRLPYQPPEGVTLEGLVAMLDDFHDSETGFGADAAAILDYLGITLPTTPTITLDEMRETLVRAEAWHAHNGNGITLARDKVSALCTALESAIKQLEARV